ncbi:hypothetical protein M0R45_002811 [Rubus argutus]|uniref:Uncharacterized protein n=1 Tax=Rubus argutus TaxID=59490 RepID=A0AAW1VN30_RUBAR
MVSTANNWSSASLCNALLNERPKRKDRFSLKEKCDSLTEYIKRLKPVIRWFQELEGSYLLEHEKLQNSLQVSELQRSEMDLLLKNKEEELNSIIAELRKNYALYKRNLQKKNWIRWLQWILSPEREMLN